MCTLLLNFFQTSLVGLYLSLDETNRNVMLLIQWIVSITFSPDLEFNPTSKYLGNRRLPQPDLVVYLWISPCVQELECGHKNLTPRNQSLWVMGKVKKQFCSISQVIFQTLTI